MVPRDRDTGTPTNKEYAQKSEYNKQNIQLSLYLSESIAKLEMAQYKRLTRSAKHEPPANTKK